MRYTLATGEPVFTGFMRTRPSSTLWALVYATLYLLQFGWPAFAGTAAGAIFFLVAGRLPGRRRDDDLLHRRRRSFSRARRFCSSGKRIVRTLEVLNWVLVATTLGGLPRSWRLMFVPARDLGGGRRRARRRSISAADDFDSFPAGADLFLLGALVAYSGAGGVAQYRAVELGARQGLRHGRACRLHLRRRRRRTRCTSRTPGSCSRPTPRRCGAGAAGGASFASISGACLRRRRHARHAAPGAALRDVPAARHATSRASASARRWRRASARGQARCSAA